jgi:hypothetical protein
MQGVQQEPQAAAIQPQGCCVGEVLECVASSMQKTCHSVGVTLALPEELQSDSRAPVSAAESQEGSHAPAASRTAAAPSSTAHKRSWRWDKSKAASNGSVAAPALLPPPSRALQTKQRTPGAGNLRVSVSSEACPCASTHPDHQTDMPVAAPVVSLSLIVTIKHPPEAPTIIAVEAVTVHAGVA